MPPLVQDFGSGVDRAVGLLVLQMRRRIPGTLGRIDSLFLDTLVTASCFGRDP